MPGICPRCNKNVYFAEEIRGLQKSWHKMCFTCANCKKMLDSGRVTEHDEQLYCKACYGKLFGPKGYGFGGGAGVLSMDDGNQYKDGVPTSNIPHTAEAHVAPQRQSSVTSPPKNKYTSLGGADICNRCGKTVYYAEKMVGGGSVWHKSCFLCAHCNKRLESTSLCERQGQIYCKACYGKNFGPKGYGYGVGAGALQMSS